MFSPLSAIFPFLVDILSKMVGVKGVFDGLETVSLKFSIFGLNPWKSWKSWNPWKSLNPWNPRNPWNPGKTRNAWTSWNPGKSWKS